MSHNKGGFKVLDFPPTAPILRFGGGGGAESSTMSNVTSDYFVNICEDVFDDSWITSSSCG